MSVPDCTEITSDTQWHELRAKNIGASEIAALFDQSPWTTQFTLWHEKRGLIPHAPYETGDTRMEIGKKIEPFIASLVAERLSLDVAQPKVYWSLPDEKIGCTLDFEFEDPEFGPAIVECKNVDKWVFADTWGETRPPLMYQFQVQHQFAVTGRKRAVLAAFVGGNELVLYEVPPQPKVIDEIRRRAAAFWQSIERDEPPKPTGTEDELRIMAQLFPDLKQTPHVTLDSHEIEQACADLLWAKAQSRMGEAASDKAKATILDEMAGHAHALVPGHRIKVTRSTNKNGVVTTRITVTEADTGIVVAAEDVRPFA